LDRRDLHLFLAASVLPAPNNSVSWLAVVLMTLPHGGVSIVLWKISDKLIGLVSIIFFLAALSADLYEHVLHSSGNNVFIVAPGDWTAWFNASVFILLALEILGCFLGVLSPGGRTRKHSTPQRNSNLPKARPYQPFLQPIQRAQADEILSTEMGRTTLSGYAICRQEPAPMLKDAAKSFVVLDRELEEGKSYDFSGARIPMLP
jgi:hypothetical protein